ncbi:MAG TPA: menaquinone biosynthesis protein [Pyrinomonadaceae bacterium]|nr:menaquinone biosynthesis protein [Pyrinomonadaceae bacterium]
MNVPRISASSYSNTAPLIWSFLYGSMHGRVEIILDNAPARSAELLAQNRVDAALVPVIAYQMLPDVRLVRGVCVGAKEKVRSVALITRGMELQDVRSVSLDTSSRTSVALTKILFREFLGFEPEWRDAPPDLEAMLDQSDCALLIGDPALRIAEADGELFNAECGTRNAEFEAPSSIHSGDTDGNSAFRVPHSAFKKFDLAQLWRQHTGLGFIFAMWMTRAEKSPLDFAAARDEGISRVDEIVSNYLPDIKISEEDFRAYLSENISYEIDEELERGMELYFDLAKKHRLCDNIRELNYAN